MKKTNFLALGVMALTVCLSGATHAAPAQDCVADANQEVIGMGALGSTATKATIGGECYKAIVTGNNAFDKYMDKIIQDKIAISALDTMTKQADTNPEAKKLKDMYRGERADFVNNILKETGLTKVSSTDDGLRNAGNTVETVKEYAKSHPFSSDKINQLRTQFTEQAKASIKAGL